MRAPVPRNPVEEREAEPPVVMEGAVDCKVIDCGVRLTVKVTAIAPEEKREVAADVAVISQLPNVVNEIAPVVESTAQCVMPAFETE